MYYPAKRTHNLGRTRAIIVFSSVSGDCLLLSDVRPTITESRPGYRRDPTRVDLSPFRNLQRLQLYHCDLSTQPPWGLAHVKGTLRYLACTGSLEQLRHLLGTPEDCRSPPRLSGTARGREGLPGLSHFSHSFLLLPLPTSPVSAQLILPARPLKHFVTALMGGWVGVSGGREDYN